MNQTMLEVFGYVGSVMVVVSMLMSNIIKLRIINTIGSVISGTYAFLCGAFPLVLMNACLIVINLWGLYKLLKSRKPYNLVVGSSDDALVQFFLEHHEEDIKNYFPIYSKNSFQGKTAYTVCCDGAPAGVLIGTVENGILDIEIDYTTPAYRDCTVGSYLYEQLGTMKIQALRLNTEITDKHVGYLHKMNFKEENGAYIHQL